MSVSVLILTLNEEVNLPRCLKSLGFSDDVVVLDSFSTDATCQIARDAGARVVQRTFDDWSSHQNWAVEHIDFKNRWVFYIDADEVADAELGAELLAMAASKGPEVACRMRRKEMLWGRWLKYSSMYPVWLMRAFVPACIRWERLVHPHARVSGPIGTLKGHIIHHSFSKGLEPWIEKHIDYARLEAIEAMHILQTHESDVVGLFTIHDPVRRRKALKLFAWRIPFRPLSRFLYMYLLRAGFLDGRAGYCYCRLISTYQYMIDCGIRELRQRAAGRPL